MEIYNLFDWKYRVDKDLDLVIDHINEIDPKKQVEQIEWIRKAKIDLQDIKLKIASHEI